MDEMEQWKTKLLEGFEYGKSKMQDAVIQAQRIIQETPDVQLYAAIGVVILTILLSLLSKFLLPSCFCYALCPLPPAPFCEWLPWFSYISNLEAHDSETNPWKTIIMWQHRASPNCIVLLSAFTVWWQCKSQCGSFQSIRKSNIYVGLPCTRRVSFLRYPQFAPQKENLCEKRICKQIYDILGNL